MLGSGQNAMRRHTISIACHPERREGYGFFACAQNDMFWDNLSEINERVHSQCVLNLDIAVFICYN